MVLEPNKKYKAKLINKPEGLYPNCRNGDIYLISSTRNNKGTHCYFYTIDDRFKGCFPIDWFEVINETDQNKKDRRMYEQLTLFF